MYHYPCGISVPQDLGDLSDDRGILSRTSIYLRYMEVQLAGSQHRTPDVGGKGNRGVCDRYYLLWFLALTTALAIFKTLNCSGGIMSCSTA